jgi:hypothetical protein
MDPNITLRMINNFLTDTNCADELDESCINLYDWVNKGGFNPDWNKYPLATSYYRHRITLIHDSSIFDT